jgi:hypothetical protein
MNAASVIDTTIAVGTTTSLTLPYQEQQAAARVDEAVKGALDLVQQFSEYDPTDCNSPWQNPDHMYQQLDHARTEISNAWKALDAAAARETETPAATTTKDQLLVAYMDMITDSFADVLENLRQNAHDDPLDVQVLVDCLQSGLDLVNMNGSIQQLNEADFLWAVDNDEETTMNDDSEEERLTMHERRRRELGFQLEESTA